MIFFFPCFKVELNRRESGEKMCCAPRSCFSCLFAGRWLKWHNFCPSEIGRCGWVCILRHPPSPPQICWVPHKHPLLCFRSTPSVPNSFTDGVQITMCNCTLPSSAAIQTGIFPDFTVKEALVFPSHLFSSSVQIFGKPYSHEAKLRCKCSRFTEQSCLCIPSS